MKKLAFLFLALVLSASAFAQTGPGDPMFETGCWEFAGVFPDSSIPGIYRVTGVGLQGVAVDGEGKVWVLRINQDSRDSVIYQDTVRKGRALRVFYPDGTQPSFSPIMYFDDGVNPPEKIGTAAGYGIRADADGNIVVVYGNVVYKFDYTDGSGLAKVIVDPAGSRTTPAFVWEGDSKNYMYITPVATKGPLTIHDENLVFQQNALDATVGIVRTMEISEDGNEIYYPWIGAEILNEEKGVILYERPDEFSDFDSIGLICTGVNAESIVIEHNKHKILYAHSGHKEQAPAPGLSLNTYYGYKLDEPNKFALVDSIKWVNRDTAAVTPKARGIAFSSSGDTVYMCAFEPSAEYIQKFTRKAEPNSVKTEDVKVSKYSLEQNYPNPFNPSTTITFTTEQNGFVNLTVYNVLGQKIQTLVNENLPQGRHSVVFNANSLTSGVYVYQLNVNDVSITKKMALVK